MKNNKLMWGLVLLIVFITIGLLISTDRTYSQKGKNQNELPKVFQKDYPIVDYNAPEPTDSKEREERRQKNKRYDTNGPVVAKNPGPKTDLILSFDAEQVPSAIPSAESSLIIIGELLNAKASLSNNKKGLYSEYTLRIQTILKNDIQKNLQPDKNITIDRAGGYVRYPNGQKVLYLIDWQYLPEVKKRYLFFLNNKDQNLNYRIITGYELVNGRVAALDNSPIFSKFNEISETDFIKLILSNVTSPSQPADN